MNVLHLTHVTWERESRTILRDINWTVQNGEHWALIGANGSGKTSLLNLINGYTWPSRGQIEVMGQRFGQCDVREIRKSIGWVTAGLSSQLEHRHAADTALDVTLSGKFSSIGLYDDISNEDTNEASRYLALFRCDHLSDRPFSRLSQGEKQRVLLARAFMAKPDLLILDEPCTSLDVRMREELLQAVQTMGSKALGPAIIYVTHHVEEIMPAFTHVLLLNDGHVAAQGLKHDVLTDKALGQALGVPVKVTWAADRPWLQVLQGAPK